MSVKRRDRIDGGFVLRPGLCKRSLVVAVVVSALSAPAAWAQQDWLAFTDPDSDSVCGVINAANAELIVSPVTGQLTKVNGVDTLIANAFFDPVTTDVVVDGVQFGFVTFTTDGDGDRTAWWVTSVSNNAIELDEFTFDIRDSGLLPSQISGAACDPTPLVDGLNSSDGSADDPPAGDDALVTDTLSDLFSGLFGGGSGTDGSSDNSAGGAAPLSLCGAGTIGLLGTLLGLCGLGLRVRLVDFD